MMRNVIETPIGYLNVESDGYDVTVTLKPTMSGKVRHEVKEVGGCMASVFSIGKRVPRPYEEITQNGSTFEVLGTRRSGDGYEVLNGNTRVWEKWLED